jgi:hypothetical protein
MILSGRSNVPIMTDQALRIEAIELHKDGCSVPDIARRVGVAKSTAFPVDPGHAALTGLG